MKSHKKIYIKPNKMVNCGRKRMDAGIKEIK